MIELLADRKLLVFVQVTNFANVKLNLYYPQLVDNIVQSAIPFHLLFARKLTNTDSCGTNMQIFDTRGMRRSFDLPVFKEMAALGFAHLFSPEVKQTHHFNHSESCSRGWLKKVLLPGARASTKCPGARLTFMKIFKIFQFVAYSS